MHDVIGKDYLAIIFFLQYTSFQKRLNVAMHSFDVSL